jgi:putative GTP pyrophosphokinase
MGSLDFDAERAVFRDFYDSSRLNLDRALGSFKTLLHSLIAARSDISLSDVEGRIKDREECLGKFNRKYRAALETAKTPYTIREKITDLIGLRVICLYEDDVERVRQLLSPEFQVLDVTNKIAQMEGTEDSFGYKGLHLDLKLNNVRKSMGEYQAYAEYPFELQIRTIVQDSWSVIDHKIKYKKSIPNNLRRRINTLAALFELADREFRAVRDATRAEIELAKALDDEIESEAKTVEQNRGEVRAADLPRYTPLNAFSFLRIAQHFYPNFEFEAQKVDGFTQEIISLKPEISRGKLDHYLRDSISDVKRYQVDFEQSGPDTMNPFTVMRHCLYAMDKKAFAPMLTDIARERFDQWLANRRSIEKTTKSERGAALERKQL